MRFLIAASVLIFTTTAFAQFDNIKIGGGIGLGSIKGNLPAQTSYAGKIFIETEPFILPFNSIQVAFTFAQKLEKIIPENRTNRYYPFINSFSLSGISKQYVTSSLFIKEAFGLLLLNDRTYDDVNTWNYGFILSVSGGTTLSKKSEISIGLDYGLTLNNTNASYFLFMIEMQYKL